MFHITLTTFILSGYICIPQTITISELTLCSDSLGGGGGVEGEETRWLVFDQLLRLPDFIVQVESVD